MWWFCGFRDSLLTRASNIGSDIGVAIDGDDHHGEEQETREPETAKVLN